MSKFPVRLSATLLTLVLAGPGTPASSEACWMFGCWGWGAPCRSCYQPSMYTGWNSYAATGWAPAGAYTTSYVPYVSYSNSACGCNPCCTGCGSGNCPSGDCSLTTRKLPADSGTAEPTPVKVPVRTPEDQNKSYKDPPLDEFRPTRPEENDAVPNRLGTPSTIPRTTPESTIPSVPRTTIPNTGTSTPANGLSPSSIFPGSTIPESTIPSNRPNPLGNTDDSALPEFRRPAPADPSTGNELEPIFPNTFLEPMEIDSSATAALSIQRGRVIQTAGYQIPGLARLKVPTVVPPATEPQVARK